MRKTKSAPAPERARAARQRQREAAGRIDRVMAERADAGDRAFAEQLEQWKRNRTEI